MYACKMMLVDIRRCKFQLTLVLLFFPIAVFMMRGTEAFDVTGILYLTFAGVIMAAQPFLYEQRVEAGFLYLLPVTKGERVWGRYLFGFSLNLVMVLATILLVALKGNLMQEGAFFQIALCFGLGMITISLQYLLFYAIGRIKSQQFAGIMMMLPGFCMYFGFSFLMEKVGNDWVEVLFWMERHMNEIMIGAVVAGYLIWILGAVISLAIVRRKDFIQ